MYICIYVYLYDYIYTHLYIEIYIESERERERREIHTYIHTYTIVCTHGKIQKESAAVQGAESNIGARSSPGTDATKEMAGHMIIGE